MRVEAGHLVACVVRVRRVVAEVAAEVAHVEDAAEVDEERVVARADEDAAAVGHRDGLLRERLVRRPEPDRPVLDRPGADVDRGHVAVGDDGLEGEAAVDALLHRVRRFLVLRAEADLEERRRVLVFEVEREAVRDVVRGAAERASGRLVLDVDLVADVLAEGVVVRPARGEFERDVVGDDDDAVGVVGVAEGVDVRVVGERVAGDQRGFAVAGGVGEARRGEADGEEPDDSGHEGERGPSRGGCGRHWDRGR